MDTYGEIFSLLPEISGKTSFDAMGETCKRWIYVQMLQWQPELFG